MAQINIVGNSILSSLLKVLAKLPGTDVFSTVQHGAEIHDN